jgi:preprotein translocase subunit SecG
MVKERYFMGILSTLLLVVFIITAVLLVLLVLVQNTDGDSLGGIFAGGSSTAFGSRTGNVLTRATTVLGAVFLILSLVMALQNRSSGISGVEQAGREQSAGQESDWFMNDGSNNQVVPNTEASNPDEASTEVK